MSQYGNYSGTGYQEVFKRQTFYLWLEASFTILKEKVNVLKEIEIGHIKS